MSTTPITSRAVLVVEDHDATRQQIAVLLRTRGYDVIEAVDGLDALKKVSSRPFDAVVLDLVMPHVDGWQFRATQLRHPELATIPTVIVTVQPLQQSARYALRAASIVQKPFDDDTLLGAVEKACGEPGAAPSRPGMTAIGELFWSRRGEVSCAEHAPEFGSPRWVDEAWGGIPPDAGSGRIIYRCQHCAGDGSPILRTSRPRTPKA